MADRIFKLKLHMIDYFSGDPKRIQHFIKVSEFASLIGLGEGLDLETMYLLETVAVVHDIGIKPAEEKYGKGHCGGKLQEQLGAEPARKMLEEVGFDKKTVERVCFLVAHHHTYEGVDGADWQILLEADFLVNAYEDGLSEQAVKSAEKKIFRTNTGRKLLETIFGIE